MRVVEIGHRLSESVLWPLQRSFYEASGPAAWGSADVPWWASNNVLLARLYARILLGWARDLHAAGRLDASRPLRVLEVAAGTGMLGFRVLQQLDALDRTGLPEDLRFRWILTDGAVSNVTAWARHPQLAPLVRAGRLAIGHFDPLAANRVELVGEAPLEPGDGPIAAVANYAFDCLPSDAYRIAGGELHDGRVLLRVPDDVPDPIGHAALDKIDVDYTWHAHEPVDDARIEALLAWYRDRVDGPFLIPVGALATVDVLTALGAELVLIADHGEVALEELGRPRCLAPLRHGAITFGANLHAVAHCTEQAGGTALRDEPWLPLSIVALLPRPGAWGHTGEAFDAGAGAASPVRFPNRVRALPKDAPVDGATLAALLEASGDDPFVAIALAERVVLDGVDDDVRARLVASLRRCMDHWLHVDQGTDAPYTLGLLLRDLGEPGDGADLLDASLELYGPHPHTYLHRGLCARDLGDVETARACLAEALALDPDLEAAAAALAALTPPDAPAPPRT